MKAIINFENKHVAVWSHEVTNDDHAILAEHGFVGWEVKALFRSELKPSTSPTATHVDQDFEDEAIKFGYQRIDPNKNTHDSIWRYSIKY